MSKAPAFQFSLMESSPFGPPPSAGIYVVCARVNDHLTRTQGAEHILYVGSSANIKRRILSPRHPYMLLFDRMDNPICVYTKHFICKDFKSLEIEAIKALRPWFNIKHNG